MVKLQIVCSDAVYKAIMALMVALQHISQEDIEINTVDLKAPAEGGKTRTQYRVIAPESAAEALQSLGPHTIRGIIFKDLTDGTVAGKPLTARDIRIKRPALNDNTIQTDLVKLRHAGLVVSEPLAGHQSVHCL